MPDVVRTGGESTVSDRKAAPPAVLAGKSRRVWPDGLSGGQEARSFETGRLLRRGGTKKPATAGGRRLWQRKGRRSAWGSALDPGLAGGKHLAAVGVVDDDAAHHVPGGQRAGHQLVARDLGDRGGQLLGAEMR